MKGFAGCLFLSFFTTFKTLKFSSGILEISSFILFAFFSSSISNFDNFVPSKVCKKESKTFFSLAKLAFKEYHTFSALNSFYDQKFYKNKEPQLEQLIEFIKNLDAEGNTVFVTHYVVILALFSETVTSGEILIANRDLKIIGRIKDY